MALEKSLEPAASAGSFASGIEKKKKKKKKKSTLEQVQSHEPIKVSTEGMVIEGMGILWDETDSPGIVVVVWMLVVWGKQEGGCQCHFYNNGKFGEGNRPHHWIPQCQKQGWWGPCSGG